MEWVPLLKRLSEAFGVPGHEEEVRGMLRREAEPLADRVEIDPLGNLLVWREGPRDFVLLLDAHMDEVGFMVSHITPEGFLRFVPLGGWDARVLPGHRVWVRTQQGEKLLGIIGSKPPHITTPEERQKAFPMEELFVDIGVTSAREAEEKGVQIGALMAPATEFVELSPGVFAGKAFDDRIGCLVALEVLRRLKGKPLPFTLVISFSVQEEVGLRGARTSAFRVAPHAALALEATVAGDTPGVPEEKIPTYQGRGPAITLADRSVLVPALMVEALKTAAQRAGVPFQFKRPIFGGTDAGAIQTSRGGVLVGVVSVPTRYIHAASGLVRGEDIQHTIALVTEFVRLAPDLLTP